MRFLSLVTLVLVMAAGVPSAARETKEEVPCGGDVAACVAKKRVEFEKRGLVGVLLITPKSLDSGEFEAYWEVGKVVPESAAEEGDVEKGDRIVGWNDVQPLREDEDLQQKTITAVKIGEVIRLRILRDGELIERTVMARKADARVIEHWLAHYVYSAFGEEAERKYVEEAMKRLEADHDH